jgi:hypothetical protein
MNMELFSSKGVIMWSIVKILRLGLYKTIILPIIFKGVKCDNFDRRTQEVENKVLMNMFGSGLDDKNGNNGFDTDKL